MIDRLLQIDVSALCDADKTMPVVDPAIRAMIPGVRVAGPAYTVVADDDHLPVFAALEQAAPGEVLVIKGGPRKAVFGELFAAEARRRGLAGLIVDGFCRDLRGLRQIGLPVFARGTTPASGTTVSRAAPQQPIDFGGLRVHPGDLVFGDDDGLIIAPAEQIGAALEGGELVARAERLMQRGMEAGVPLHEHTNFHHHTEKLDAGEDSALAFTVHD